MTTASFGGAEVGAGTASAASAEAVRVHLDFSRGCRRLALLSAVWTALAESSILYRLWVQLSGSDPSLPALGLVYGFAGRLIDPFRALDTVHGPQTGPVLEFPALVALEGYLIAGVLVAGLLLGLAAVLRWAAFDVMEVELHPRAYRRELDAWSRRGIATLRSVMAGAGALAGLLLAWLRSRDWQGYRAGAVASIRRAAARGEEFARARVDALRRGAASFPPLLAMWGEDLRTGVALTAMTASAGGRATLDLGHEAGVWALVIASGAASQLRTTGGEAVRSLRSAFRRPAVEKALNRSRLLVAVVSRESATAFEAARQQVSAAIYAFQAFENGGTGPVATVDASQRMTRRQFLQRPGAHR